MVVSPPLEPNPVAGRWVVPHGPDHLRCEACPRHCTLRDGQRGWCQARLRRGGAVEVHAPPGAVAVDPIEKKPLYHFLPGSRILSIGTPGCCLACRFCQNWELSRAAVQPLRASHLEPGEVVALARAEGCNSVAFTYSEPLVVTEWVVEVAQSCRAQGLATVAVTSGFVEGAPREVFFGSMDAANVDLKGFDPDFYRRYCAASLDPVLETLKYLAMLPGFWLEITTLLIPGLNDDIETLERQFAWHVQSLGPAVPLHLSAFHPAHRMLDHPPTPGALLDDARRRAIAAGIRHVYVGNRRSPEGETTWCPTCGVALIRRSGYRLLGGELERGACRRCGTPLVGRFAS